MALEVLAILMVMDWVVFQETFPFMLLELALVHVYLTCTPICDLL